MTEVDYGGGGHRTRVRNDLNDQLVCLEVPPASVYKGAKGEGCGHPYGGAGGVLLLLGGGFLPHLAHLERPASLPSLLYIRGEGGILEHTS